MVSIMKAFKCRTQVDNCLVGLMDRWSIGMKVLRTIDVSPFNTTSNRTSRSSLILFDCPSMKLLEDEQSNRSELCRWEIRDHLLHSTSSFWSLVPFDTSVDPERGQCNCPSSLYRVLQEKSVDSEVEKGLLSIYFVLELYAASSLVGWLADR